MNHYLLPASLNIGDSVMEVFSLANIHTYNDIVTINLANDTRITNAIEILKKTRTMENNYWLNLLLRCHAVINKLQNPIDAIPYPPWHFVCPLTLNIIIDPVVAPNGVTYERQAIIDFIKRFTVDPFTKIPLTEYQLYPNVHLKAAIAHYKQTALRYPVLV